MAKNDIAKIKETARDYCAALKADDPAAWGATLDGKVTWLPPDAPRLKGKKAVVAFTKTRFFEPYKDIFLSIKFANLQVAGKQAFASGSFSLDMTPKAGGAAVKVKGKHMDEFRKQRDGSWKYSGVIWNYDNPLA
jgi:ketosteroid isomerase-like protein